MPGVVCIRGAPDICMDLRRSPVHRLTNSVNCYLVRSPTPQKESVVISFDHPLHDLDGNMGTLSDSNCRCLAQKRSFGVQRLNFWLRRNFRPSKTHIRPLEYPIFQGESENRVKSSLGVGVPIAILTMGDLGVAVAPVSREDRKYTGTESQT